MRRILAGFTRLERLVPGSVELPHGREDFDDWANDFPRLRVLLRMPVLRASGAWLACHFLARNALTDLLREAAALGYTVGYQVQLQPYRASRERLREARLNAGRVRELSGIPAPLAELQQRLAAKLSTAVTVYEEFLGAETPPGAQWLAGALRRAFRAQCLGQGLDPPPFEFSEEGLEDALATGMDREAALDFDVDELCASSLDEPESRAALAWWPTSPADFPLPPSQPGADEPEAMGVPLPSPSSVPSAPRPDESAKGFIFVSYQHGDAPAVRRIIEQLQSWSYPVWYDRGIPGGTEWDAWIEKKVEASGLLLLFLTPRAVESRYVRREVKFADALAKPLVALQLEPSPLRHGLAMLLTQYQILDSRSPQFLDDLRRAIDLHLQRP